MAAAPEDLCACGDVLDEHDVTGSLACLIEGCGCIYFDVGWEEDDE